MAIIEEYNLLPQSYLAFQTKLHNNNTYNGVMQPTPYYVREGQIIEIEVSNSDNLDLYIGAYATSQRTQIEHLGNGTNYITAKTDGPLIFSNQSQSHTAEITMTMPDEIERLPYFKLGETTNEEFQEQLELYADVPNIIWENERAVVIFNRDFASDDAALQVWSPDQYMTDPEGTVARLEAWIDAENALAGYTREDNNDVGDSAGYGKAYLVQNNGGTIGTGKGYIAFNGDYPIHMLAHPDEQSGQGWGQLHELGHSRQQGLWTMSSEANPNIYGWNARAEVDNLGFAARWRSHVDKYDNAYDYWRTQMEDGASADTKLTGNYLPNEAILDQLYSAFGPGFYQNIHHIYRLYSQDMIIEQGLYPTYNEAGAAGVFYARSDQFYIHSCEASGYDLTEFFETWRWNMSDEARETVEALDLPKLPIDLAAFSLGRVETPDDFLHFDWVEGPKDLPEAVTNDDMIVQRAQMPNLEDLIEYDPTEVAKVEFMNSQMISGAQNEVDIAYGRAEIEILITGVNGEQNVALASVLVVPEDWGDISTKEGIYQKVLEFYETGDFLSADQELVSFYLQMLNYSGAENSAWLFQALRNEWTESNADLQKVFDFIDNLGPEDIVEIDGKFGYFYSKEVFDLGFRPAKFFVDGRGVDLSSQYFAERGEYFLSYDPANDPLWTGANSELQLAFRLNGVEVIKGDNVGFQGGFNVKFGDVPNVSKFSAERIDWSINYDDVSILDPNSAELRIHSEVYDAMLAQGDFEIEILLNGEVVGTLTNTGSNTGVTGDATLSRDDNYVYLLSRNLVLDEDDKLEYAGVFASDEGAIYSGEFGTLVSVGDLILDGSDGDDGFAGTGRSEALYGLDGNDIIAAGNGDDFVDAGAGDDMVYGGEGADKIEGGDGADNLRGGLGDDMLYGGMGLNRLFGEIGNDKIFGGAERDYIYGGEGDDQLAGLAGSDFLIGEAGNDILEGGDDNDNLWGGEGNDDLYGNDGIDRLRGDGGSDRLFGGAGLNFLEGGADADFLSGGAEIDNLFGGEGIDTLYGGAGNDIFYGGADGDYYYGGDGKDRLYVGSADIADGGKDNDFFYLDFAQGNAEQAVIDGGALSNLRPDGLDFDRIVQTDWTVSNLVQSLDADGNSHSGSFTATNSDGQTLDVVFSEIESIAPICFVAGSEIETEHGAKPVEALKIGDLVMTKDNGLRPIRWIGSSHFSSQLLAARPEFRPVKIARGAFGFGLPERDLYLSPQHRVLVNSRISQRIFGVSEVLAPIGKLTDVDGIDFVESHAEVDYYHIMFDDHEIVYANGLQAESLLSGPEMFRSMGADARAEIAFMFPELMDGDAMPMPAARPLADGGALRSLARRHQKNAVMLFC